MAIDIIARGMANKVSNDIKDLQNTGVDTVARERADEALYEASEANYQLEQSGNKFKPTHSVWEEFEQRGVNVTWFGAVADANYYDEINKKYYKDENMTISATDNSQAFADAVNFLFSIGGGTLYVPSGNYCFRLGVEWHSQVSMIGDGTNCTKFVAEGELFNLFYNIEGKADGSDGDNPEVWLENCRFENFACDLQGLSYAGENVDGKALFIMYMKKAVFRNLLLENTIGTALGCDFLVDTEISNIVVRNAGRNWGNQDFTVYGIGQSGIGIGTGAVEDEALVVSNCFVYDCGNFGIFVETQGITYKSKNAKIVNCHTKGNRIGISNRGSGATMIQGCTCTGNIEDGIALLEYSFGDVVSDNIIENNGKDGIELGWVYVGHCNISNNVIRNNAEYGIRFRGAGTGGLCRKYVNISTNDIISNGFCGILISGGAHEHINIKDNTIANNGQLGTNEWSSRGVYLEFADSVKIVGNTIYDNQTTRTQLFDIDISSTVTNYYIDGNSVSNHYIRSNAFNNGVFGTNEGIETVKKGIATFNDGVNSTYIIHYFSNELRTSVKNISLTPFAKANLWVEDMEDNQIKIVREDTSGSLDFFWKVEA